MCSWDFIHFCSRQKRKRPRRTLLITSRYSPLIRFTHQPARRVVLLSNTPKLALFDFDGTISRKDSMLDFIQFAMGKRRYFTGLLKQSPMLLTYVLNRISNSEAKQALLAHYFSRHRLQDFEELAQRYAQEKLPGIIRPKAIKRIQWHQNQGHKVLVISASAEDWLKPWTEAVQVELIASQLDKSNGMMTGRLQGNNCHGPEKVARLKKYLHLNDYTYIYAYGDSSGDNDMLALADEAHYKPFR